MFTQGPERYHLYHRRVRERPAERHLAILLDLDWIERVLLPQVAQVLSIPAHARLTVANNMTNERMATASTHAALTGVLSPWRVTLQDAGGGSRVAIYRPSFLFAGTILFVLTLLMMGVLLLVRDVSRERALTRLRSDFVSAASHELRTPLTMIRLYAQTLLEDVDADREERRGSYEIIAEETERLKHLLDKVLDFSRVDRHRRKYRFERTSLHSVVTSAIELYEPQLRRRGFILEKELSLEMPPVLIDPEAVMGAVLNLLDNAAKYSGTSRRIQVRVRPWDGGALVEVVDEGVGIDAADHERIFEQFYRCGQATETGGYGLGLFLVKHVMDAHGGRVMVTSELGKGSCFRLVFSSAEEPQS
jgi:signal transduction histidine kinase